MSIPELIREKLASLTPERLDIADDSALHAGHAGAAAGGGHYKVSIVSPLFRDQSAIVRHQMVYAALGELMQQQIHALSLEAYTPEEFSLSPR